MAEAIIVDNQTGEVVTADDAWERYSQIVALRREIEKNFLDLAEKLFYAYEGKDWKKLGYANFNAYLGDPEVNLTQQTAQRLIEVYERYIIALKAPPVPLLTAGYSKLHKLLPYVNEQNMDELISLAGSLSRSDLQKEIESFPGYSGAVSDRTDYSSDEWHTPQEYIDAAREVMGEIDLDPATCETAQANVQAKAYFTKEENGLDRPWHGRVWLNPPYSMPLVSYFVMKVVDEYDQKHISEAIVLVNNSSDTKWFHQLLERFPACFTRGRVQFWHPKWKSFATRQGQAFFYLGPNWKIEIFQDIFSRFGVTVGKL